MHKLNLKYESSEPRIRLKNELNHARDVLRWVYLLSPNKPSFELEIASLFHDSERWLTVDKPIGFQGDRDSAEYLRHKKKHAKRSADFADSELEKNNADSDLRLRIRFLIEHHDDTGEEIEALNNPELNILVAADSFSFFTSIAPDMLEREGPERLKDKAMFMVEKMPQSLRLLLAQQTIGITEIDNIKNEALSEFL